MTITLYQASVPVFIRSLRSLSAILHKIPAYAGDRGFDPAALLSARLYPDMHPLSQQVLRTADAAVAGAARLAGLEVPAFDVDPQSLASLDAYVEQSLAFLAGLDAALIDGQEQRTIAIVRKSGTRSAPALRHLLDNVLPNFYFHLTTAYGILRHNGLEIGKQDYLGRS